MKKSNKLPESWCVEITPEVLKHPMYGKLMESSRTVENRTNGFVGDHSDESGTLIYSLKSFAPEITIDQWCAYTGNLPFDPEKPMELLTSHDEWISGEEFVYVGCSTLGYYVFEEIGIDSFILVDKARNTPEFKENDPVWYTTIGVSNRSWEFGKYYNKSYAYNQHGSPVIVAEFRPIKDADGNPVYPPFND